MPQDKTEEIFTFKRSMTYLFGFTFNAPEGHPALLTGHNVVFADHSPVQVPRDRYFKAVIPVPTRVQSTIHLGRISLGTGKPSIEERVCRLPANNKKQLCLNTGYDNRSSLFGLRLGLLVFF